MIIQGRNIIQALTENISNSEKMQRASATTLIFIFFQNLRIFINKKNGIYSKPFNSQLKEIKGKTVYHFEIISLAISIAFLNLLVSCTFRRVLSIIS